MLHKKKMFYNSTKKGKQELCKQFSTMVCNNLEVFADNIDNTKNARDDTNTSPCFFRNSQAKNGQSIITLHTTKNLNVHSQLIIPPTFPTSLSLLVQFLPLSSVCQQPDGDNGKQTVLCLTLVYSACLYINYSISLTANKFINIIHKLYIVCGFQKFYARGLQ